VKPLRHYNSNTAELHVVYEHLLSASTSTDNDYVEQLEEARRCADQFRGHYLTMPRSKLMNAILSLTKIDRACHVICKADKVTVEEVYREFHLFDDAVEAMNDDDAAAMNDNDQWSDEEKRDKEPPQRERKLPTRKLEREGQQLKELNVVETAVRYRENLIRKRCRQMPKSYNGKPI